MGKKILVVDDNLQIRELITNLLEDEGHQVSSAQDGLSALDVLVSFIPDIIFIDLIMPKIGGDKFCKIVRKMEHMQDCYIVLVSAAAAEMDFDCTKIGADACIAKGPIGSLVEHVLEAVRESDSRKFPLTKSNKGFEVVHLRRMTQELLSQNRHWETILDSMSEGILEIFSNRIVYANSAAVTLFGVPQEELLSAYLPDLFSDNTRSQVETLLESKTDQPQEIGYNEAIEINDKRITLQRLPFKGESLTSIIMIQDVTERLRAETELQQAHDKLELRVKQRTAELVEANAKLMQKIEEHLQTAKALRESEERFRELAQLLPETIFETDATGRLTFVNHNAFDHFGYTPLEMGQGLNAFDMIAPYHREMAMKNAERILDGESIGLVEFTAIRKDKSTFPALIHSTAIYQDGKPCGLRGFVIDISEKKQMETQLQQALKMEAIGTLTGGIAHDFNNILGIIIGNTELALDDIPEWNPVYFNLEEIKTASLRAKDIIRQLLSYARKTERKRKPIKLIPVINDALNFLRATIPATISIRKNIQATADTVLADPTQIYQIMLNLGTNAFHAMEESGGVLEVEIQNIVLDQESAELLSDPAVTDYIQITVRDTGHGISSEIKNRIFDPYFTTKEIGKGSGMGLSVVHGIISAYQGSISVDSNVGEGTTFTILLPLIAEKIETVSKPVVKVPTGTESILLVDDEKSIVNIGRQTLERLGYQIETRQNPLEALDLLRSQPTQFDLVITDMTMPQMTGDQLAKEILKIRPDMPIILCTGFSEKISKEKALEIGVKAYALKPLVMPDLAVTVRNVLDGNKKSGPG